jgi:hypothetical protein
MKATAAYAETDSNCRNGMNGRKTQYRQSDVLSVVASVAAFLKPLALRIRQ